MNRRYVDIHQQLSKISTGDLMWDRCSANMDYAHWCIHSPQYVEHLLKEVDRLSTTIHKARELAEGKFLTATIKLLRENDHIEDFYLDEQYEELLIARV